MNKNYKTDFHRRIPALIVLGLMLQLLFAFNAFSAPGSSDFKQAFDFMKDLGCVSGSTDGKSHLDDNLTRAQAVTILVNCMGQGANAKLLTGAPSFPDSGHHWASGAIAVAKNKGWVNGMPDGKFHPEDKVTYAQMIQMLDSALGIQTNAALGWPERAVEAAVDAGFVSEEADLMKIANEYASRGVAFFYSNSAFKNVTLTGGKNVYQTYLDTDKPSLTMETPPAESDQTQITLAGTAKGAASVSIDGKAVTLKADFSWSGTISLGCGDNTFKIVAVDKVGNNDTKEVKIKRIVNPDSVTQDIYSECTAQ